MKFILPFYHFTKKSFQQSEQTKVQWNKREIKKLLDISDTMAAAVNITAHRSIYSVPLCTEIKCSLNLFL